MAIFRPSNINKRLVGTSTLAVPTDTIAVSSSGNGGQIGATKLPVLGPVPMSLGQRCTGGASGGVFRNSESFFGVKSGCKNSVVDCKGNLYCVSSGNCNHFVVPKCAETGSFSSTVSCANSLLGCCGWFEPTPTTMSAAYSCSQFWEGPLAARYQANTTSNHPGTRQWVIPPGGYLHVNQYGSASSRAFRCVAR
jgi:hypothetical protein